MKGVFCGHDHNNDFYGVFNNIMLGYGRKTGYGSYGPPDGWYRGARVFLFDQNININTWIREENGQIWEDPPIHNPGTNQTFKCCPN